MKYLKYIGAISVVHICLVTNTIILISGGSNFTVDHFYSKYTGLWGMPYVQWWWFMIASVIIVALFARFTTPYTQRHWLYPFAVLTFLMVLTARIF